MSEIIDLDEIARCQARQALNLTAGEMREIDERVKTGMGIILPANTKFILPQKPFNPDWHKRTCGECGYFWYKTKRGMKITDNASGVGSDVEDTLILDDSGCSQYPCRPTEPHSDACPDFVLRPKEETSDENARQ